MREVEQVRAECDALRKQANQHSMMQSMLESKESKVVTLESEIRLLEEELGRMREAALGGAAGALRPGGAGSTSSGIEDYDKIIQHLRTNERILRARVCSFAFQSF